MVRLGADSKLEPAEVLERAERYFGPGGLGLQVAERRTTRLVLEGGGGGVEVSAEPTATGSNVELESREWDNQARSFLGTIS
jgi:hypothetical protein